MDLVENNHIPAHILTAAEAINPDTYDSVEKVVGEQEMYMAKFISPTALNDDIYQVVHCAEHKRSLYGIFLKPNGDLALRSEAKNFVPELMREEVQIVAKLTFDCPARLSKEQQIDAVQSDLNRLLDADSTTGVECISALVTQHRSEAEIYHPRDSTPDNQAHRILEGLIGVYEDEEPEPLGLLTNALCDLRHLCDNHGLAFNEADKSAHQLYLAEKG